MTTIDYQRIGRTIDRFRDPDPYQAYYMKDSVDYRHVGQQFPPCMTYSDGPSQVGNMCSTLVAVTVAAHYLTSFAS